MFTKNISPMLNQFFIREFKQLMNKYNSISEKDTKKIERLLRFTEEIEGKEYIFQDFNRALALVWQGWNYRHANWRSFKGKAMKDPLIRSLQEKIEIM